MMISKNPIRKIGGRLDVTFPGEVCEVAVTQTTYLTPMPLKVLESVESVTFLGVSFSNYAK